MNTFSNYLCTEHTKQGLKSIVDRKIPTWAKHICSNLVQLSNRGIKADKCLLEDAVAIVWLTLPTRMKLNLEGVLCLVVFGQTGPCCC